MSRRLEIGALLGLCFFLPLYEAPKSIFWALYVLIWLVNRWRARDWGGRWDRWDTLIAAWIGSGFIVAVFAGLHGDEWRSIADLVRIAVVLWLVKRSFFANREVRWILGALLASSVVGVAMASVALWRGLEGGLQLNSVGHVNHTAIYLAMMLGVCASWLFAFWRSAPPSERTLTTLTLLLLLVTLVSTSSRAAIGVGLAMLAFIAAAWWRRWHVPLYGTAGALVLAAAVIFAGGAEVLQKQEANMHANNVLAFRDSVWRVGLEAWKRYPFAGVGIDNYKHISVEQIRAWRTERHLGFNEAQYANWGHGHSLYVNTLAERGVVGSIPVAALLFAWLAALLRLPRPESAEHEWLLWGSAASAFLVTSGVGLANTTLHHEHGILAMLLLGLWLSKRPER